jgi:hypothetical protein
VIALLDSQELFKLRQRARYYSTMAAEAEQCAARTTSLEAQALYLKVAIGWRILAERTERDVANK